MEDISEVVEDFKCAFDTLEEDVAVLEAAKSLVATEGSDAESDYEQLIEDTTAQLEELQETVEGKKEIADAVSEFCHPCGGGGWTRVVYYDFREPDVTCPGGFTASEPDRPHACLTTEGAATGQGASSDTILSFTPPGPYSSVCGRIAAYQVGAPQAFRNFAVGSMSINQPYMSGISLTRGGTLDGTPAAEATHIWSFAAGFSQNQGSFQSTTRCPCDGGDDPPPFVGEDYFCESAITVATGADPNIPVDHFTGQFLSGNILWDGLGCIDTSDCCSRIDHPYFVKHLGVPLSDDIEMRVLYSATAAEENLAIELIEIYVQ